MEELDPATGKTAKGLERCLKEADEKGCRFKMIATDGAFSMDGDVANLKDICDLAEKYDALVMVDDSHATGFMGKTGRGTHEHYGVMGRVDIITTTFGKALGGASGGCISGRKEIIDWLRNKARPYLFSNTVAPVGGRGHHQGHGHAVLHDRPARQTGAEHPVLPRKDDRRRFRHHPRRHPITPIMFGKYPDCSKLAVDFANAMLDEGIYVIAFSFPVVPAGQGPHPRPDLGRA